MLCTKCLIYSILKIVIELRKTEKDKNEIFFTIFQKR